MASTSWPTRNKKRPDGRVPEAGAVSKPGKQLRLSYRIGRFVKPLPWGTFFSGNTDAPRFAGSIPIGLRRQAGFQATMRNGHVTPAAESAAYAYLEHVSGDISKWPRHAMKRVEFDPQRSREMRNSCPLNLSVTRMVSLERVTLLYVGPLKATCSQRKSRST